MGKAKTIQKESFRYYGKNKSRKIGLAGETIIRQEIQTDLLFNIKVTFNTIIVPDVDFCLFPDDFLQAINPHEDLAYIDFMPQKYVKVIIEKMQLYLSESNLEDNHFLLVSFYKKSFNDCFTLNHSNVLDMANNFVDKVVFDDEHFHIGSFSSNETMRIKIRSNQMFSGELRLKCKCRVQFPVS